MGVWDWNIRANQIKWSDNLEPVHGLAPGTFGGTLEAFQQLIHPDDREPVQRAIARAPAGPAGHDIGVPTVYPGGSGHRMAGEGGGFTDDRRAGPQVRDGRR